MKTISVIVPIYNAEKNLERCVNSILHQSYQNLDVILVNDGSTDESGKICDRFAELDNRVRVLHKSNGGPSEARNFGLHFAKERKNEYVAFVDSDDYLEADMFEILVRANDVRADIIQCGYYREKTSGAKKSIPEGGVYYGDDIALQLLLGRIDTYVWNKLYKLEIFKDLLFPNNRTFEDIAFMHRLLFQCTKVKTVSVCKYHYVMTPNSITHTYSAENLVNHWKAYRERFYDYQHHYLDKLDDAIKRKLLKDCARAITRMWRYYYMLSETDRDVCAVDLAEMTAFSNTFFPLFGYREWPRYLRITVAFTHSTSKAALVGACLLNKTFLLINPKRASGSF